MHFNYHMQFIFWLIKVPCFRGLRNHVQRMKKMLLYSITYVNDGQ
jgi:hypothetical protein